MTPETDIEKPARLLRSSNEQHETMASPMAIIVAVVGTLVGVPILFAWAAH
jgi:hypothetical protein